MHQKLRGLLTLLLSFSLCFGYVPVASIAYASSAPAVTNGSFKYKTTLLPDVEASFMTSSFTYRDDCFMRSSFLGCTHLSELSMELANTSGYKKTVVPMLQAMGFADVEVNRYLDQNVALEDSMGVAVGRRTITDSTGTHTLLAVVPRGAASGSAWVGNMRVGSSGIHQGFNAARDEVLRFLKNYVAGHGITGDLKIWVCGHSRAAAVSTLVAGFFAEGGASYLGSGVTVDADDIYCYAIATPTNVKAGATKAEMLSVAGSRDGAYAAFDSAGTAWDAHDAGTVDPHGSNAGGIRNYINGNDIVSMLLPGAWGFTRYGTDCTIDADGFVTEAQMLQELATYNPVVYQRYQNALPSSFAWKMIDLPNLSLNDLSLQTLPFVASPTDFGAPTISAFEQRLVAGMAAAIPSNGAYVEGGYQEALGALMPLVLSGVLRQQAGTGNAQTNLGPLLRALLFSHISYAGERLGSSSDAETLQHLIGQLTDAYTGIGAVTVDDLLRALGKFVYDNGNSVFVSDVLDRVIEKIPSNYRDLIVTMLSGFVPASGANAPKGAVKQVTPDKMTETEMKAYVAPLVALVELATASDQASLSGDASVSHGVGEGLAALSEANDTVDLKPALIAFLKALYAGAPEGSGSYQEGLSPEESAKQTRITLYAILTFVGSQLGLDSTLTDAINLSEGNVPISQLAAALLPRMLTVKDGAGTPHTFQTFREASVALFAQSVTQLASVSQDLAPYATTLSRNAAQVMNLANNALFTVAGQPYSLSYCVAVLSTLLSQYESVAVSHFMEPSVSYARVINRTDPTLHSSTVPGSSDEQGQEWNLGQRTSSGVNASLSVGTYAGSASTTSSSRTKSSTTSVPVKRLAGSDRYQTMAEIVNAGFTSSEVAVMAVGTNYADALAATPLAGALGCPVVLTDGATLSQAARDELVRLGVKRVCVAGGANAISEAVIAELRATGIEVERIAGADRTATSVEMMRAVRAAGSTSDTVVIASGMGFADALSIGSWAYATKSPILLTAANGLLTQEEIDAVTSDALVKKVVIVGGLSAVGDVESQLGDAYTIDRLAGADRYETSAKVAAWAAEHGLSWRHVVIATGTNYPDALAGAAYAGTCGNVMLLVDAKSTQAVSTLSAHKANVDDLVILGGEGAVSASLADELARACA